MRRKFILVNGPISKQSDMVNGLEYFWYATKNGNNVGQGYHIEGNTKNTSHAKRKIRKLIESREGFSYFL